MVLQVMIGLTLLHAFGRVYGGWLARYTELAACLLTICVAFWYDESSVEQKQAFLTYMLSGVGIEDAKWLTNVFMNHFMIGILPIVQVVFASITNPSNLKTSPSGDDDKPNREQNR